MKRLVVPLDLGGATVSCALQPPRRPPPTVAVAHAMIEHYVTRASAPDDPREVEVAFFHGGLPSDALLDACAPHPIRVACSPADLSRAAAASLRDRGVRTIEVDLRTFDRKVLRACRRGYTGGQAAAMLRGLRELGFRVGAVLAPGLPGSSHAAAVRDAEQLVGAGEGTPRADFVRILPALAYAGTDLARWAQEGRWVPMTVAQATETAAAVAEVLRAGGVEVARIGEQPGQDVPVEVVAGPAHPNLRARVEALGFRARMEALLRELPRSHPIALRVHPKDLSWAKGTSGENIRVLRARLRLAGLSLVADASLPRGSVALAER